MGKRERSTAKPNPDGGRHRIICPGYDADALEVLKSKKKVTRGKDDREVYAKLLRFAAGRGFETRETSRCLKQLFNGNDYEDDFE